MIEVGDLTGARNPPVPSVLDGLPLFRELFEQAPGLTGVVAGPDHVILSANPAVAAFVGRHDLVGRPARLALPQFARLGFDRLMDKAFSTGKPFVAKAMRVTVARPGAPEPEVAYLDFVLQPIREADGAVAGILFQGQDVTKEILAAEELRATEEKLRQAQKMEAIGRLSGGVAHDFNNLLTVVIGAAETLVEGLDERPELGAVARVALEAAERGADLVGQLLAVSRAQPLAPQAVDCRRFLTGLAPMLRRTFNRDIEVVVEPGGESACALADLTQLTSAVLNLCINARDAMPDGGQLTLAVRCEGDAVGLIVDDSGEGMSPQVRARALEPFFTTKAEGKGSGLGLSMVYGFAVQSGGRLEIDTEPGLGTTVSLWLPRAQPGAPASQAPAPPAPAPARGLRVLLVDDDDLVRGQVERHLVALGCRVRACSNGHDALDILACGGEPVDLLMTDINMPGGMNGRQLADHARLLAPDLRILFTSGHTEDPILRTVRHDPRAAFIAKPYRRAELARKLVAIAG